ncbi:MAG: ATPase domain-containing protein [ANME-2 cluster archaeon]|nr:ATPase domain-containing protein [ANME-2 cluster archaeon]
MKQCSSGIVHLDEILGGGLPKPSLVLVSGTAGVGKTTFVLQMLSQAAQKGERAVYMPITSQSDEKLMDYLHIYPFFSDDIMVHPINRSTAEKDPLTTLLDMGNILASTNPDRLVINPLDTLGFGFPSHEKRRFFYSFDSMIQDWSAQTMITGELNKIQLHQSILPHIADGVIYLDRELVGDKVVRKMEIMKWRGIGDGMNDNSSVHEFKITSNGISIFPKLESHATPLPTGGERLSTGVEGLDSMMHGGIPAQSFTILTGCAGVGKTMLGLQFIAKGLELGEPCIIVLFEEKEGQLIYEASKLGWDLEGYIRKGLLKIIYSNPTTILPDEHNQIIRTCVEEMGAKRLFYDGVNNLESIMQDPVDLKNHIRLLINFLKSRGVTVILTNEVSGLFIPDRMPELSISSLADGIIMLHFMDGQNRYERALSILKLRGSDHDMSVRKYIIGDNGVEIIQKELIVK